MKMPLLLRFLVVGGINTGFSYCVYVVLAFTGLNYALANLGSLIAGILFSFKAQGRFVFRNSDRSLFWRFVLCWALIYAANVWFITQAMRMGLNKYAAGAGAIPAIAVLSFVVQRYVVFGVNDREDRDRAELSAPPPAEG
jgi:putative flippase GtrA